MAITTKPAARGVLRGPGHAVAALVGSALLASGLWAAFLGWDTQGWVEGTSTKGPYTAPQVVAFVVVLAGAVTLLSRWRNPFAVATGVTAGVWVPFTVTAARSDDSGLWAVGSLFLLVGMVMGTTCAATLGYGLRAFPRAGSPGASGGTSKTGKPPGAPAS